MTLSAFTENNSVKVYEFGAKMAYCQQ